jgi:pilus assembly protein Flp/PilA
MAGIVRLMAGHRRLRRTLSRVCRAVAGWRPVRETAGVTAMEYGLIAALIAVAIIAAITLVGTKIKGTLNAVSTTLTAPR